MKEMEIRFQDIKNSPKKVSLVIARSNEMMPKRSHLLFSMRSLIAILFCVLKVAAQVYRRACLQR